MRKLPRKPSKRQKQIIEATKDFLGESWTEKKSICKVALWLMNRRKGLEPLTEEEREAVWYIRRGLSVL